MCRTFYSGLISMSVFDILQIYGGFIAPCFIPLATGLLMELAERPQWVLALSSG
jgi:hypothetical protein